jgi:hypothetical protein
MLATAKDWDRDAAILQTVEYQSEMISFRIRIMKSQLSDLPARPEWTTKAEDALLMAANHAGELQKQLLELYRFYRAKPVS